MDICLLYLPREFHVSLICDRYRDVSPLCSFDANSIQIQPEMSLTDLTSTPAGVATGTAHRLTTAFYVRLQRAVIATWLTFYLVTSRVAIVT